MRLERLGGRHRNDVIERDTVVRPRGFQHVGVTVGQHCQLVMLVQNRHAGGHVGKTFQLFNLRDEITDFFVGVRDARAFQRVIDGDFADAAIGNVLALKQRVYHRVLEMRASPPRDERVRPAAPAFAFEKRRCHFDQSTLHVDDCAVLVEHQELGVAAQFFDGRHKIKFLFSDRASRAGCRRTG